METPIEENLLRPGEGRGSCWPYWAAWTVCVLDWGLEATEPPQLTAGPGTECSPPPDVSPLLSWNRKERQKGNACLEPVEVFQIWEVHVFWAGPRVSKMCLSFCQLRGRSKSCWPSFHLASTQLPRHFFPLLCTQELTSPWLYSTYFPIKTELPNWATSW